jgi:hypothetical protein
MYNTTTHASSITWYESEKCEKTGETVSQYVCNSMYVANSQGTTPKILPDKSPLLRVVLPHHNLFPWLSAVSSAVSPFHWLYTVHATVSAYQVE